MKKVSLFAAICTSAVFLFFSLPATIIRLISRISGQNLWEKLNNITPYWNIADNIVTAAMWLSLAIFFFQLYNKQK